VLDTVVLNTVARHFVALQSVALHTAVSRDASETRTRGTCRSEERNSDVIGDPNARRTF
jgi:hypothetical protein